MNTDKKQEIIAYLLNVKSLLSSGKYDFVPRRKNMMSLAQLGLTIKDAKDIILSLTISDYYKGPKEDYDSKRGGHVWEFKTNVNKIKIYIKVKITIENDEEILKCLSFHEDDFE